MQSLKKLDLITTANYNQLPQDRTVWYSINYKKINELSTDDVYDHNQSDVSECLNAVDRPLGQNEPMGGPTPFANKEEGDEPMGGSKWTNASGQTEPMQGVNMSRPLPETTTENTREQQQPQWRDDDVSEVEVKDKAAGVEREEMLIDKLVGRYKEISGNDDLRPLFLYNLIKSCRAVCFEDPASVEKYVLEKLDLLRANLETVKSPLRFFIAAMKEDWTQAQPKVLRGKRADPNCPRCGGEGWLITEDTAYECACRVNMARVAGADDK
ncbi:MAG: hypothetical protein NUK65_11280 [Firmicutes bacterium]|nr:hypothetical protein [Bacillota bacterium]